jgi:uncharacterized protein
MKPLVVLLLLCISVQSCKPQIAKDRYAGLTFSKGRFDSLQKQVPEPTGYTSDYARIFSVEEEQYLDSVITAFEKATTAQIGVATVDSSMVSDADFEDYTLVMMKSWGVGKKEKNNGILVVIAPDIRRIRIQNGYGIEKILSDAETKVIIDNVFIPRFQEGKYFEGTRDGLRALMEKLEQEGVRKL